MTPPEPTRIRSVAEATRGMSTSGAEPAKELVLWCSATQ
jgi:hypothetical protein